GSTFSFTLDVPVLTAQYAQAPASRITGYGGARRTVLVVDDIAENRAVLRDLLYEVGFNTCEATSGQEAMDTARSRRPDLVLMDIVMPDMSGLEAIRGLRQIGGMERLPIIAVSASATSS